MKTLELLIVAGTFRIGTWLQFTMPKSPAGFEHVHNAWNKHGGCLESMWSWKRKKSKLEVRYYFVYRKLVIDIQKAVNSLIAISCRKDVVKDNEIKPKEETNYHHRNVGNEED